MYKEDLALNNLQWLICHKTQQNQILYIWYICIKRIWHWITNSVLVNAPAQAETLLHSLEQAPADVGFHVNAHKMEYMCFNQRGDISTLNSSSLKLVDKFTYLESSVSSTKTDLNMRVAKASTDIDRLPETDLNMWLAKALTDVDRLLVMNLTDEIKHNFFQAAVVLILLYGCTTWTLTKRMEKKLDSNYTRILQAILNKSWR